MDSWQSLDLVLVESEEPIFGDGRCGLAPQSCGLLSELNKGKESLFFNAHGCGPRTNRARSRRSIANGVMHLIPRPMQASGILIFFVEVEAISWVTRVCPWASAWAT